MNTDVYLELIDQVNEDEKAFTTEDFKFTYKKGYLYDFQMCPSKNVKIKTLRKHNPHDYIV